jgi:hypothetical protein
MKKQQQAASFLISCFWDVTQAQTVQTVKNRVLMSIIWTRRLNL